MSRVGAKVRGITKVDWGLKHSRYLGTTIGPLILKPSYSWLARGATSAFVEVKGGDRRESDTLGLAL
jgi:prepilin signal peptidase PulO-like enzyme (type II secretory pathway)